MSVFLVLALLLSTPHAMAQPQRGKGWLALGDSYSSGEGIENTPATPSAVLGRDCRRASGETTSAHAWAADAYEQVKGPLRMTEQAFVACTGAIADEAPAQIDEANAAHNRTKWDLVTMSFGGNNIRFSEVIKNCILPRYRGTWRTPEIGCSITEDQLKRRIDMLAGEVPIEGAEYRGSMTLPKLLDRIAGSVAPGGDVIMAGYPNLVEDVSYWTSVRKKLLRHCSGIRMHDVAMLRRVGAYLNERIARAVKAADERHQRASIRFHFLDLEHDPYELDEHVTNRHARCAGLPYLNGFVVDGNNDGSTAYVNRSYHPNSDGHRNTALTLAAFISEHVRLDDGGGSTTTPPARVDPAFVGAWQSLEPVKQPGSSKTYWVQVSINEAGTGRVFYPGLECGGPLTVTSAAANTLVLREVIDTDPNGTCIKENVMTLVPTREDRLSYLSQGTGANANARSTASLVRK